MTITTDQAVALALEVLPEDYVIYQEGLCMTLDELTTLCNAVRKQTLEEAAAFVETEESTGLAALILRDMAAEVE